LRVPDSDVITTLDRIRDEDPYIRRKVAQYEILPWNVMGGREDLDKI